MKKEGVEVAAKQHRIRITLTSRNVRSLESGTSVPRASPSPYRLQSMPVAISLRLPHSRLSPLIHSSSHRSEHLCATPAPPCHSRPTPLPLTLTTVGSLSYGLHRKFVEAKQALTERESLQARL